MRRRARLSSVSARTLQLSREARLPSRGQVSYGSAGER